MEIRDHCLSGESVCQTSTPNQGGTMTPRYLVMHFTAGRSAQSSVDFMCTAAARASAHLVIGRDGKVWQLVPFNRKAWHAGVSAWAGVEGLNNCSIGIELDNAGRLKRIGSQYQAWFGGNYGENEVVQARHRNENAEAYWHAYSEPQISAALAVGELLVEHYGLEDVLGHDDIAPGRKSDPGPAFPMASFKSHLLGRQADLPPQYRVNAGLLNVRAGPGASYALVREPLPQGTLLSLLDMSPAWANVRVADGARTEGWVANQYIVRA